VTGQRGADGVLTYVQELGRRRPAAYLLGCAAAGFAAATVLLRAASTVWSMARRVFAAADQSSSRA